MPIKAAGGEEIEAGAACSLCRCGRSANKPFCDGMHAKIDFSGEEVADRGPIARRRVAYQGKGVTIYDDRSVCSHAGHCTDNLASVFKLDAEPWIDPEGAGREAIIEVVGSCPSGALSYAEGDSADPVEQEREPAITRSKDGPYWVVGGIELQSADGSTYERRARYALCRCGGSKNKPFCDGTHWHISFKDG